ncbi:MAG: hypothetical protein MUC65_07400, partial [Pontiellaceae bacterium]|nr:hypothetical protein [Pontiellaceae bacterium]
MGCKVWYIYQGFSSFGWEVVMRSLARCISFVLFFFSVTVHAAYRQVSLPMSFHFEESAVVDSFVSEGTSLWIPTGLSEMQGYLRVGNIPFGFLIHAKFVIEYEENDVVPGRLFNCRGWLEEAEDPDQPEFYSCFGIEFGARFRPIIVHRPELSFGKDFSLTYSDNGPMPLKNSFLGGIDNVEFASIPVDEFIPGSSSAAKALKSALNVAGNSSLNIGSINLCGEGVLEGSRLTVGIGDHQLVFTNGYGAANGKDFTLYVPMSYSDGSSPAAIWNVYPRFTHNFYQTVGLAFCLVSPLEFTISPAIVERAG